MSSSEAQPDVEFWMENDALHVLQQTFDADGDRFTPLAEHVLDGTQSPVRHSISLLLKAESTSQELDEITRELRELRPGNGNHAEILLHRLRNVGVREPAKALRLLMELKNEPWYDGSTAESGSDVERDLKLIEAFDAAV